MPKKKGDKGGNPNPIQTEEFLAKRFQRQGSVEGELAAKPLAVRVPVDIDKAIRALPNKAEWIREAIVDAAIRDGLCSSDG